MWRIGRAVLSTRSKAPVALSLRATTRIYQVSRAFSEEGYPFGIFAEEMCIDLLPTTVLPA